MASASPLSRLTGDEWICTVEETILAGKSAPAPPAAPDPKAVAQAQGAANAEAVQKSAEVNQINQVSPFGSQTYSGTVGQPDRTVTTTLNPTDQATLDAQRALASELTGMAQGRAGQINQGAFSLAGLPGAATAQGPLSPAQFAAQQRQAQDAAYKSSSQYLDPQFAQSDHDLDVRLRNQGLAPGDEGYDRAMGDQARAKQAAYSDARNQAITAGNAEQSNLFGMAQAASAQNFGQQSQVRSNALSENLLQRQEPMNELAALLQGAPAMQTPNFGQPAQYNQSPADVTGAFGLAQAGRNAAYQGQVSQANSANQSMAGLGSAGLMAAMMFGL